MSEDPQPQGARARHTHYERARNGVLSPFGDTTGTGLWHIRAGHPGGAYSDLGHELDLPAEHTPTVLTRYDRSGRDDSSLGACLRCTWEGSRRSGPGALNRAVEDAHDHAFPGWRTLPTLPPAADGHGRRRDWHAVAGCYPAGWLDRGAPVLRPAVGRGDQHRPPHAARPRYELRIVRPAGPNTDTPDGQEPLF
ncbi:DUF6349 family protein [Streptacidiphilus cavernicola]|uniref:DUF6349 family protein n=1 Tax=Streptacidiphilus cavernicola TaxID=3342716 RepID=A0ABV6UP05_9ACTN